MCKAETNADVSSSSSSSVAAATKEMMNMNPLLAEGGEDPPKKNFWDGLFQGGNTSNATDGTMDANNMKPEVRRRRSFLDLFTNPSNLSDANEDTEASEDTTRRRDGSLAEDVKPRRRRSFLDFFSDPSKKTKEGEGTNDEEENNMVSSTCQAKKGCEGREDAATSEATVEKETGGEVQEDNDECSDDDDEDCCTSTALVKANDDEKVRRNILEEIIHDYTKGDQKILRAIGRTALVNLVVAVSAFTGGALSTVAGFITGGAITAKRLGDGIREDNPKEVAKSLAVYSCATTASITGQAIAGALMITVAGATIPVAAAVAFGVGCTSGITAGALSEWGVDHGWNQWSDWLRENSKRSLGTTIMEGSSAQDLPKKLLVDVPMKVLCGPQDELVKQKLLDSFEKFSENGHRWKDEQVYHDTTESTTMTESDSDSDMELDYSERSCSNTGCDEFRAMTRQALKRKSWGNRSFTSEFC